MMWERHLDSVTVSGIKKKKKKTVTFPTLLTPECSCSTYRFPQIILQSFPLPLPLKFILERMDSQSGYIFIHYTFKNKGPKREFHSDAVDFCFPKEPCNEQFLKESFFISIKNILKKTFFLYKECFVEWKDSSDVKGSLWNHLC